ncbi:hypothetical protein D3C80_1871920 [compost metagenome]
MNVVAAGIAVSVEFRLATIVPTVVALALIMVVGMLRATGCAPAAIVGGVPVAG